MNDTDRIAWVKDSFTADVVNAVRKVEKLHKALLALQVIATRDDVDPVRLVADLNREVMWVAWNIDMQGLIQSAQALRDARGTHVVRVNNS